jgi:predicted P-loop ATPase
MAETFIPVENFIKKNYDVRFNEIANVFESRDKGNKLYEFLNENDLYCTLINNKKKIKMSDLTAILKSKFTPRYNPIADYFKNLTAWQPGKKDHIGEMLKYIEVKGERLHFETQFKKMLIRCIACGLNPSVFNKHAFVLISEQQNLGKTTFLRWLCPPTLKGYYTENISIDKDSLIALTENWMINMDELANLSRLELNSFKSFLSKDCVKIRRPYDRTTTMAPRIANFFGSTNKIEFLTDETGNVRWLCFEVVKIDFDYAKKVDINGVWSQAYYQYLQAEKYQLTADEVTLNDEKNKSYYITTAEQELILKHFEKSDKKDYELYHASVYTGSMYRFMTCTDIVAYLYDKYPNVFKLTSLQVGKALKAMGYVREEKYKSEKGFTEKGYYIQIK